MKHARVAVLIASSILIALVVFLAIDLVSGNARQPGNAFALSAPGFYTSAKAASIASIERALEVRQVQRTTTLTRDASLKTAMEAYLARHEHLEPLTDDLLEKALALDMELVNETGE